MRKPVAKPNKPIVRVEPRRFVASTRGATPHLAKRNAVDFPQCDAAVQNLADGEWKLADAIVAECSETGEDGVRNGSQTKMEAMGQEIAKNHGVELSLERIRKLRRVASAFPPGRRRPGVSVEAHLEAATPDTLDGLIKAAPAGTTFTRANIRALKHPTEQAEQSKQQEEQRRQAEDHRMALQDVCRKLEQENELLRQRYEDSCRSAGKEPEPLSPPLVPEEKAPSPPGAASPMEGQTVEKAVSIQTDAGVTTGDGLDVPPFLTRRPFTDEENKQYSALESAWPPFALALAKASPLVRHRFETEHNVTLPKTPVEHAPTTVAVVDGDAQPVAVVAQQQ